MKKIFRKIGKLFIELDQKQEEDMCQSILLVDTNSILPNNFALIIKDVKEKFKNANLVVLTFQDKEEFIRSNFPEVEVIIPTDKTRSKRYPLGIRQLLLLRRNFRFIVLSSLDIFAVFISLMFFHCPVFLHNRWLEWYRLRPRTLSDVLHGIRSADRNRRRIKRGMKSIIKSFGRIFVILCDVKEQNLKSRILILDNGYTEVGYILSVVRKAQELFINPDITILTLAQRKQDFINSFPGIKLVVAGASNNRDSLIARIYKMRKDKFTDIILTALDIVPMLISFLCFRAKIMLYNQWHQWWSLRFRGILGYFKQISIFLAMIPIYIYLFITAGLILFRTAIRSGLEFKSVIKRKNEKRYNAI